MNIPSKASVTCSNGLFCQSTHVVLILTNGETNCMTVANRSYSEIEYLICSDHNLETTVELIRLNCTCEDLTKMPVFGQVEFIRSKNTGGESQSMFWADHHAPDSALVRRLLNG